MSEVIIKDDLMFAQNKNITYALYGCENANIPYKYQKLFRRMAPIRIKRGY